MRCILLAPHRLHQSQSSLAVETMKSSTSVERRETRYRGEAVAATATAAVQKKESRVESSIEKRRTQTLAVSRRKSKVEGKREKKRKEIADIDRRVRQTFDQNTLSFRCHIYLIDNAINKVLITERFSFHFIDPNNPRSNKNIHSTKARHITSLFFLLLSNEKKEMGEKNRVKKSVRINSSIKPIATIDGYYRICEIDKEKIIHRNKVLVRQRKRNMQRKRKICTHVGQTREQG